MANELKMTPQQMRTRAKEADNQGKAVEDVIKAMDTLLNNLKAEWKGEAVKGYEERYQKVRKAFVQARDLLIDEIAPNLRTSAQTMEEADQHLARQYRR